MEFVKAEEAGKGGEKMNEKKAVKIRRRRRSDEDVQPRFISQGFFLVKSV